MLLLKMHTHTQHAKATTTGATAGGHHGAMRGDATAKGRTKPTTISTGHNEQGPAGTTIRREGGTNGCRAPHYWNNDPRGTRGTGDMRHTGGSEIGRDTRGAEGTRRRIQETPGTVGNTGGSEWTAGPEGEGPSTLSLISIDIEQRAYNIHGGGRALGPIICRSQLGDQKKPAVPGIIRWYS
jgi:hypothetical protein